MKLEKLKRIFTERNIDKSSYSINISPQEKSYCINEIDDTWEVFYFERKEKKSRKEKYLIQNLKQGLIYMI